MVGTHIQRIDRSYLKSQQMWMATKDDSIVVLTDREDLQPACDLIQEQLHTLTHNQHMEVASQQRLPYLRTHLLARLYDHSQVLAALKSFLKAQLTWRFYEHCIYNLSQFRSSWNCTAIKTTAETLKQSRVIT